MVPKKVPAVVLLRQLAEQQQKQVQQQQQLQEEDQVQEQAQEVQAQMSNGGYWKHFNHSSTSTTIEPTRHIICGESFIG